MELTTTQEVAAWCLQQPVSVRLSAADRRHLFAMESWPQSLPIKPQDVLRTTKLYHRIKEAMDL
ncbi:hypothetical protein I6F15_00185 [Bradyrhizobium sp. BRP14]|nr:hypothetical protein [Bradyrhizobium sp. BRP14]